MEIILTGSRAYGPAGQDSDYDFVMLYYHADEIRRILDLAEIPYEENLIVNPLYKGFSCALGVVKIQVIVASDNNELQAWKHATESMQHILPITDREERIAKFQSFYQKELEQRRFK